MKTLILCAAVLATATASGDNGTLWVFDTPKTQTEVETAQRNVSRVQRHAPAHRQGHRPTQRQRHRQRPLGIHYGGHVHGVSCGWANGYYIKETIRVWIPAQTIRKYVPAVFRYWWDAKGKRRVVMAVTAHYEYETIPGRYEPRTVPRWIPGYWSCFNSTAWR